jgi:dihydrofolate reductase
MEINMSKVIFNMTVSLDGFVAGLNDGPENGLGDGGDALFNWYFSGDVDVPIAGGGMVLKVSAPSAKILNDSFQSYGAGVWGRRTFDFTHAWGGHPPGSPAFIVTHNVPEEWVYDGSPFTFVTDGVESAIRQAKQAAGDKNVVLCTASILQQALNLGLVDEIYIDVAPFLLGKGVRLFDHLNIAPTQLENILAVNTPNVTHLGYRVVK